MARKKRINLTLKEQLDKIETELKNVDKKIKATYNTYQELKSKKLELESDQSKKLIELLLENRRLKGKDDNLSSIVSEIDSNNQLLKSNNNSENENIENKDTFNN